MTATPTAPQVIERLREALPLLGFLLLRIGGWTQARWDQHLRYEFGDDVAGPVIVWLNSMLHDENCDRGATMRTCGFCNTGTPSGVSLADALAAGNAEAPGRTCFVCSARACVEVLDPSGECRALCGQPACAEAVTAGRFLTGRMSTAEATAGDGEVAR